MRATFEPRRPDTLKPHMLAPIWHYGEREEAGAPESRPAIVMVVEARLAALEVA